MPTPIVLRDRYTYEDILYAYLDCRRLKRNKRSALEFELRFEDNLLTLLEEVNSGNYEIGRSEVFVVTHPKPREIWAAQFRDRIVHHLIYADIGQYLEERFIEDTYSCIKGKGTLAASNRVVALHRRVTRNYATDCYVLQFDIKNFFVSINKYILWDKFERHVGEPSSSLTSNLLYQVLWNDPTVDPIIKPNSQFELVPKHKSLWNVPYNYGLPIGNLLSQVASNVYLDDFDKFVKHVLGVKAYVRYVDDAVIFSTDRAILEEWKVQIGHYLKHHLELTVHPDKCTISPASQGINFVGYVHKPWRRYTCNSTLVTASAITVDYSDFWTECDRIQSTINSYLGHMVHTASFNNRRRLVDRHCIPGIFTTDSNCTRLIKL